MVETDGAYRTQDMALATVLVSAGFKCSLERLNSQRVCWVFADPRPERAEDFENLLDAYESHSCRVEPRSFIIETARVREEMMGFLGIPSRRRLPDAPSAQTA
jgi:hypothetical protein